MAKAQLIDHTLLGPGVQHRQIEDLAGEAKAHGFHSVCINPCWVPDAAELLRGTGVAVCTVIGFPHGATTTASKAFEAREAVANGAGEVDMVMNIGRALDGRWDLVEDDIRGVVDAVDAQTTVKVILETCLLTDEQIGKACQAAVGAGADFVKTSTGFSTGGATVHAVGIMRRAVGPDFGVKASGGIHTSEEFDAMVAAGANRIGASAGLALIGEDEE